MNKRDTYRIQLMVVCLMSLTPGFGSLAVGIHRDMPGFSGMSVLTLWPFIGAICALIDDIKRTP